MCWKRYWSKSAQACFWSKILSYGKTSFFFSLSNLISASVFEHKKKLEMVNLISQCCFWRSDKRSKLGRGKVSSGHFEGGFECHRHISGQCTSFAMFEMKENICFCFFVLFCSFSFPNRRKCIYSDQLFQSKCAVVMYWCDWTSLSVWYCFYFLEFLK